MKVAIRTDASSRIGTGHLVRCLTLAEELHHAGADVRFLTRPHDVPVTARIVASGFALTELPPAPGPSGTRDGDYAAWLGVSQEQDAEHSVRALGSEDVDLLVVDHYGLDSTWESKLAEACGSILVIDDLADRPHAADLLLDPNLRPDGAFAYSALVPDRCRVLSGPSYALIRDEYVRARRPWRDRNAGRVLVTLGGVDDPTLIRVIVEGLSELDGQLDSLDVVIADPGLVSVTLGPLATGLPLRIFGPQPHLADLMAQADIAVGAGGGTTWERLCVGLPSVVTSQADNQRRGTRELAIRGVVVDLGASVELTSTVVRDAVNALAVSGEQRRRMHELGRALVDGHGRKRVVESIIPTAHSALTLRQVTEADRDVLWMWANDRTVREQSLNSAAISWDAHVAWFQRVQDDPDVHLLVLEAAGLPIGQLRFDLEGSRATVNYSLDACVRGRGWGRRIVEMGTNWLSDRVSDGSLELVAIVRADNLASAKVFERLGFAREVSAQGGQNVFRFTRTLRP